MATFALTSLAGAATAGSPIGTVVAAQVGAAILGSAIDEQILGVRPPAPSFDRKVGGASYDTEIPILFGTHRFAHLVVLAKDLEKKTKSSKSSGKKVSAFSTRVEVACVSPLGAATPLKLFGDKKLVWASGASNNKFTPTTIFNGTQTTPQPVASSIVSPAQAFTEQCGVEWEKQKVNAFNYRNPQSEGIWAGPACNLQQVGEKLLSMMGVPASAYDLSAVAGVSVRGLNIIGIDVADALASVFDFYAADMYRAGGVIRARLRQNTPDYAIEFHDLGSSPDGSKAVRVVEVHQQEAQLPYQLRVAYGDSTNNYQQGSLVVTRDGARRRTGARLDYTWIAMTPAEAEAFAWRALDEVWIRRVRYEFTLGPKYTKVLPCDVVTLPLDASGTTETVRITRVQRNPLGELECEAIRVGGSYTQSGASAPGTNYGGGQTLTLEPATAVVWSGIEPFPSPEPNARPAVWVAVTFPQNSNPGGVELYYQRPASSSWVLLGVCPDPCNIGTAEGALSSVGAVSEAFDLANPFIVALDNFGEVASCSQDEVRGAQNWAILGQELIGVAGWSVQSGTRRYQGSTIARGLRGTPMTGHAAGDRFAEIANAVRFPVPSDLVGQTIKVRPVGDGQSVTDAGVPEYTVTVAAPRGTSIDPQLITALPFLKAQGLEYRIFVPRYTTQDPSVGSFVFQWQRSVDNGATWAGPDGTTATWWTGHIHVDSFTGSQVYKARCRAKAANGDIGAWVESGAYNVQPDSTRVYKEPCRLATAAALPAYTRVGNVLTASANGALPSIDGVPAAVGDRVLLNHGASFIDNGPMKVISLGSAGTKWELNRAEDADDSGEIITAMIVPVSEGATHADSIWLLASNGGLTINVDALSFVKVAQGGAGSTATQVVGEEPSGTKNGVNTTFTLANTPVASSESVYCRNQRLWRGTHYTISGATITISDSTYIPQDSTDALLVDYRY